MPHSKDNWGHASWRTEPTNGLTCNLHYFSLSSCNPLPRRLATHLETQSTCQQSTRLQVSPQTWGKPSTCLSQFSTHHLCVACISPSRYRYNKWPRGRKRQCFSRIPMSRNICSMSSPASSTWKGAKLRRFVISMPLQWNCRLHCRFLTFWGTGTSAARWGRQILGTRPASLGSTLSPSTDRFQIFSNFQTVRAHTKTCLTDCIESGQLWESLWRTKPSEQGGR